MEAELQRYLDTYESTHDYDEYHFDLDTIEHDPYVLISIITALHQGEWTLDEVQGTLQMLFDRQYILTEDVVVETRYRTETDTWTDADGNTHTDTYQVPYDYYICTVTLRKPTKPRKEIAMMQPTPNETQIHTDELVDIREVSVDKNLPKEERIAAFIRQIKNPYRFRCGDFVVNACFAGNGVTLEECLQGILR